jgi:hypothetical protein
MICAKYFAAQSMNTRATFAEFRRCAIMTTPLDLEQIEKKTWASFYEDGFSDIGVGFIMLSLAFLFCYGTAFSASLFIGMLVPPIGRRFITYPRMGRVKLRSMRPWRRRKGFIWIFCLVIAFAFLFIVVPDPPYLGIPSIVAGLIMGIAFLVFFGAFAYYSEQRRMYAYGLLMGISMVLTKSMDNPADQIILYASCVLMVLIGLVMTARFLRKYPKPAIEDMDTSD